MSTYSIALIGGDGIGPEILREGKKVMDAAAEVAGITWQWKEYPYGAEHWLQYRKGEPTLLREEEMAELGTHDAVYFGSVGDPRGRSLLDRRGRSSGCASTSTNTSTCGRPNSCAVSSRR